MRTLIDERSLPPLRVVLGRLLARAGCADIAVSNMRLAMLDLSESELSRVRRCRILLGRLDSRALDAAADASAVMSARALLHFIDSGCVEIRSAGLANWTPDFSVYRELNGGTARTCLIGAHYFREPVSSNGPSFTVCIDDDDAIELICRRFEELWENGYDVTATITATVKTWADRTPAPAADMRRP